MKTASFDKSDTPLTDHELTWGERHEDMEVVSADFARQLERENAQLRAHLSAVLKSSGAKERKKLRQ